MLHYCLCCSYSSQIELLLMTMIGATLLFIVTPIQYGYYCATNDSKGLYVALTGSPLVPLTTMFKEWPTLSSCVTGAGSTLMFTGFACIIALRIPLHVDLAARDLALVLCAAASVSMWVVIATSFRDETVPPSMFWLHAASAAVLMVSTLWLVHTGHELCVWAMLQLRPEDVKSAATTIIIRPKRPLTASEYSAMELAATGIRLSFLLGVAGFMVAAVGMGTRCVCVCVWLLT